MATTKNITMKQFNGTDYDTLYPKTIASQINDVYSKNESLSNATKSLFGLDSTAIPDSAFAYIHQKIEDLASADVKIATGNYIGTGTYGSSNPNSLTFDFVPKLVFIFAESSDGYTGIFFDFDVSNCYQLTPTITSGDRLWLYKSRHYSITFDKNFSWYYDYTNGMEQQFNTSGTTYDYIAIG